MASMGEHAVVLGGSVAGLTTAGVLADRFDRVTIVERDESPPIGEHRRGVPQGRHGHVLLPSGVEALTWEFPGLLDDLRARGAVVITSALQLRFHLAGGLLHPVEVPTNVDGVAASRPLLEGIIRERVRSLPGVRFVEGCDARGLTATADRSRVTGVRLLSRADSSAEEMLEADLVVDATGRGSRTPHWLEDLDYTPPEEERVRVGTHYTTRLFRRHPDDLDGCLQVLVGPVPGRRGGFAQALEGDRWLVTLNGMLGERAPTDLAGFIEYARSLPTDDIHEIVAGAEPLGEAQTATYPAHTRRRYDRLDRFPGRYLVIGDALCSFNPVYGQGMTVAAQEAAALADVLDRHGLDRVGPRFFDAAHTVADVAWELATGSDLADPGVEGRRTARWRLTNAYLARVLPVAQRDPVVARALIEVISLLARPETLLRPRILGRVLAPAATHGRRASSAPKPVTSAADRGTVES